MSLRTDPAARELTVAVGGPEFFRHLINEALPASQDLLPQVVNCHPDALPTWRSVLLDQPNELIRAAPGLKPRPFEIVVTLPRLIPRDRVEPAVEALLLTILAEYRKFIAYGANL